ncbi:MAG TPA: hypothetical protein VHN12_09280, partial [Geobacteraceae bacterium]|nr:hypothetical protein [Geobacteraceae bacterium]
MDPLPSPGASITISTQYGHGWSGCYTGQWTSFNLDSNSVRTLRNLMTTGNPTPLQTGDNIWIQPGVRSALYGEVIANWLGKDVLLAIVDGSTGITKHAEMPIKGFATFHIDSADRGAKTVTGRFIPEYSKASPGTRPGGSVSDIVTPPLMVDNYIP